MGRGSRTAQVDADPEAAKVRGARLFLRIIALHRFLIRFRQDARLTSPKRETAPPPIVVACRRCGFHYTVRRIDFGENRMGALWVCGCGSDYIPPGGETSYHLVRP